MTMIDMSEADRYGVRNATAGGEISDIQAVATWLSVLRYGDMMKVASGIAGADAKDEDVIALADKLHTWAAANKAPEA